MNLSHLIWYFHHITIQHRSNHSISHAGLDKLSCYPRKLGFTEIYASEAMDHHKETTSSAKFNYQKVHSLISSLTHSCYQQQVLKRNLGPIP